MVAATTDHPYPAQYRPMIFLSDATAVHHWPGPGRPVLYIHGATFPAALSVGYRFAGRSWADDLQARGHDVWAFDFAGYGRSGPPTECGRAGEAAAQIARVVAHVGAATGHERVSIIAHSWGTIAACRFAADHPAAVDRLVLFGPIARRATMRPGPVGDWRDITVADQLARFIEDVPPGHQPVLLEPTLAQWGPAWIATDPQATSRTPPAVRVPGGPAADIQAAWAGDLAYDPARVVVPTLIVRGAWDSLTTDDDAAWLRAHLGGPVRDVVVPAATHLMHLEHGRDGLFAATAAFLS